ncbi:MAG: sulfatase [Verrucomicrobiota bacterium]
MLRKSLVLLFCLLPAYLQAQPNFLFITVDDMNCDSIGAFGCPLEEITPSIDKLAAESLRFDKAHVVVGNCFPSRNVMFSGRYPHSSGVEGFYPVKPTDFPVLCDLMQQAGYYAAIRGKVSHSTPYQPYAWDADLTILPDGSKAHLKDAESYYTSVKTGIESATEQEKPFFINVNISDPHKPFWKPGDKHPTSRVYTADEVPVPGYLWDDPIVREELALYYSSVRRADDCVGEILRALEESGKEKDTIVMFLSDHGMPLPFSKTQLYHHSTKTPLIIHWPGVTKAGAVDEAHLVSAVDLLPTWLEIANIEAPAGLDGKSFVNLIKGQAEEGWDHVYKEYNENSGGQRAPIRAVETHQFLYLFNPWSDGVRKFKTATQGTATYRRMKEVAPENSDIAARLNLFDFRVVEELYDVSKDPDCLVNLAENPEYQPQIQEMRQNLGAWLEQTNDPANEAFANRDSPELVEAFMARIEAESAERRANRRKNKKAAAAKNQKQTKKPKD